MVAGKWKVHGFRPKRTSQCYHLYNYKMDKGGIDFFKGA